jgi:hypothetical protein
MEFFHSADIWSDYPELAAGAVVVDGVSTDLRLETPIAHHWAVATSRLADQTESELPEVQAWRLTPGSQYCAGSRN